MRNLTIKREKRFVACLAKAKVYIEDPVSYDILINNIPCRKLGDLKNGETKTFPIGEQAAKVFVIADKLSKNFCNDYFAVPEGYEDVFLTGRHVYNPGSGNAFRFDNNDNAEVVANRKRGARIGWVVLIAAVIVGGVLGFLTASNEKPKDKTFSSHGLTVTLTDEFEEVDYDGYTATFGSKYVAVLALEEPFASLDGVMGNATECSVRDYAALLIDVNRLSSVDIQTASGLTYFVYDRENTEEEITYRYFSYVYKADDAFWMIQFGVSVDKADEYEASIAKWAKTVTFAD